MKASNNAARDSSGVVFSRFQVPSVWRRLLANVLDGLIFTIPFGVALGVAYAMIWRADGAPLLRDGAGKLTSNAAFSADFRRFALWFGVVAFPISFIYQAGMVVRWGQTLGKRWCGTRIVAAVGGGPVGWPAATIRFFVASGGFSLVSLVLSWTSAPSGLNTLASLWVVALGVSILANPLRRGWHDHAAGTIVVLDRALAMNQPPPPSAVVLI